MSYIPQVNVGLDALKIQDNQHLKNALINCDDPLKAISDFQEENCILLPTLKPALNLLDLHSVKRLEFNLSIAEELKEHLTKRVEDLASSVNLSSTVSREQHNEDLRKLEELLDKSFPLINMPRLTPLIMLIMKSIPKVHDMYLNYLNENENLYNIAPIEVKRQIWSFNTDVFMKELKPYFDKFIGYFDEILTSLETSISTPSLASSSLASNIDAPIVRESLLLANICYTSFFKTNKKHSQYVAEIVKLIGTSNKLYQFTINKLLQLYLSTHDWFYATLKNQLIIKMSEVHNHETLNSIVTSGSGDTQGENVFKFATLINSCLKEKKLESKRAKELETIMEWKKFDRILPDVAFILADPFVIDMLARNAMSLLNRCVQNELLPRNCTELIFVLRLLLVSLFSWEINKEQTTKEPKMDASLITEYLPNLAYFITDYYEKLYDDSIAALTNPSQPAATPSLLTSPPTILNSVSTTSPSTTSAPTPNVKTSPPIVLKISTRKFEILSSIKTQIAENELCSTLLIYLVIVCVELNDWVNLKVLLPAIRYPNNNSVLFEKWFLYQLLHMLNEKHIAEQFKHDWFVTMIFDEFLFNLVQQKDAQLQSPTTSTATSTNVSNSFYEQMYKLIDKLYPAHLTSASFTRLTELIKPKKMHSSSIHIAYLKLKSKMESSGINTVD